jgi:radical SAM superfamily enzyme YgiQ (UPF0313 family)
MPKTKVLLVYPKNPVTYWSYKYALSFIGKKSIQPPLGLLTVAALLPEEYFDLRLIDTNVTKLRDADIRDSDLVMISSMIVQKESFASIVGRCNGLGVPVAAGGPYPTSCRDEIRGVDFFILNEGEVTVPLFVADWIQGHPQGVYESTEKPDLAASPVPRFDLVDHRKYAVMSLQFSRGCPHDCEFCDIVSLFGRVPRVKSAPAFLRELDALYAAGARGSLFIVDDNFIGNKAKAKELLRAMIPWQAERGYPFKLITEASVELARDDELLDLMAGVNFSMVFVGLETPVPESLASIGKVQNLRMNVVDGIRKIQEKGIEVTGGFIIGFDDDPPDVSDRQIKFTEELAIPVAMMGLLTALPKTGLSRRLEREGRLIGSGDGNNTGATELNFEPLVPVAKIVQGYYRTIREIYRPRAYFNRCLELLRRFPESRRHPKPGETGYVTPTGALYLLRSLVRQTFTPYGFEYLRFVLKALKISPLLVGDFITMAIQGRHLMKVTNAVLRLGRARIRQEERFSPAVRARTVPA